LFLIRINNKKGAALMLVAVLLIPFAVNALKQIRINISAEIKYRHGESTFCIKEPPLIRKTKSADNSNLKMQFDNASAVRVPYLHYKSHYYDEENLENNYYIEYNDGETFKQFFERTGDSADIICFGKNNTNCNKELMNLGTAEEYANWFIENGDIEVANCLKNNQYEEGTNEYSDYMNACHNDYINKLYDSPIKDSSYGCYTAFSNYVSTETSFEE